MRTRPAFSQTKMRPSGAKTNPVGALKPEATFSLANPGSVNVICAESGVTTSAVSTATKRRKRKRITPSSFNFAGDGQVNGFDMDQQRGTAAWVGNRE